MKYILIPALLIVCVVISPVSLRADSIPDTSITLHAPVGYRLDAATPPTSVGGFDIISITGPSLMLGHFDQNGAVQGGDAVLVAFIDLGSAPIPAAQFGTSFVTPSNPFASGPYPVDVPLSLYEIPIFLWAGNGIGAPGSSGTMYLGLALLDSRNESLQDAIGVTVPFEVAVGQPGYIFGDSGNVYQYAQFSRGGASQFSTVPEPSSFALLGTALIGLVARTRKRT